MSDIWSFYDFANLMEADFQSKRRNKTVPIPNTSGETEAPETPAPTPVAPAEAPQSGFVPKRASVNPEGPDPMEKLGGRATKIIGKGQERKAAEGMSDQEAAAAVKEAAKKSPFDAISTLNDVNGNCKRTYWVTIDTLRKLRYEIPEVPMEDHPRWVPTRGSSGNWDGGYERGYWREVKNPKTKEMEVQTNGGGNDGPYVTINGQGPYSVKIDNPRHIRKITRAIKDLLRGGHKINSAEGEDHAIMSKSRDIGFNDMDLQAGREGEERDIASGMRGKIKAKHLGGKPGLSTYQAPKEVGGSSRSLDKLKNQSRHSLRAAPKEKVAPEMKHSGPSEEYASQIAKELEKHLGTLDQVADVAGEDSSAWESEANKIQTWAKDTLKYKAAQLQGTDIWDELQSISGGMDDQQESRQWNEWLQYADLLEHIYD